MSYALIFLGGTLCGAALMWAYVYFRLLAPGGPVHFRMLYRRALELQAHAEKSDDILRARLGVGRVELPTQETVLQSDLRGSDGA